jgi:hypothetical protein
MPRCSASSLALPDMPLKVVCGPAKYPGRFRVADLGSEAAAVVLYFRESFLTFGHAEKLEQPGTANY